MSPLTPPNARWAIGRPRRGRRHRQPARAGGPTSQRRAHPSSDRRDSTGRRASGRQDRVESAPSPAVGTGAGQSHHGDRCAPPDRVRSDEAPERRRRSERSDAEHPDQDRPDHRSDAVAAVPRVLEDLPAPLRRPAAHRVGGVGEAVLVERAGDHHAEHHGDRRGDALRGPGVRARLPPRRRWHRWPRRRPETRARTRRDRVPPATGSECG